MDSLLRFSPSLLPFKRLRCGHCFKRAWFAAVSLPSLCRVPSFVAKLLHSSSARCLFFFSPVPPWSRLPSDSYGAVLVDFHNPFLNLPGRNRFFFFSFPLSDVVFDDSILLSPERPPCFDVGFLIPLSPRSGAHCPMRPVKFFFFLLGAVFVLDFQDIVPHSPSCPTLPNHVLNPYW